PATCRYRTCTSSGRPCRSYGMGEKNCSAAQRDFSLPECGLGSRPGRSGDAMHESAFSFKLRHLVLPVLAAMAFLTAAYSAFNWYFVARDGFLPLDDSVADIWLPLLIALA